jgi:hypothetical protein
MLPSILRLRSGQAALRAGRAGRTCSRQGHDRASHREAEIQARGPEDHVCPDQQRPLFASPLVPPRPSRRFGTSGRVLSSPPLTRLMTYTIRRGRPRRAGWREFTQSPSPNPSHQGRGARGPRCHQRKVTMPWGCRERRAYWNPLRRRKSLTRCERFMREGTPVERCHVGAGRNARSFRQPAGSASTLPRPRETRWFGVSLPA